MARRRTINQAAEVFNQRLKQGGQRIRITGRADIYERKGAELNQINDGARVKTRALLSNRIQLSGYMRGIGNVYGSSIEEMQMGLSGEFLPEVVDGGKSSTGGITPHLVAISERVTIAQRALSQLPAIRYRAKATTTAGPHRMISHRQLIDAVCVRGSDMNEIALTFGWFVKDPVGAIKVPKQQSQKIKAGLIDGLEAIEQAWTDESIDVSHMIVGLEIG